MTARKKADEKPRIEEQPPDEPEVLEHPAPPDEASPPARTDTPPPAPTPAAGKGETVLRIDSGGDVFATGRDDVPELTSTGTAVPDEVADDLIAFAADNDVTVSKLKG